MELLTFCAKVTICHIAPYLEDRVCDLALLNGAF